MNNDIGVGGGIIRLQKFAERLHDKCCSHNYTDYCGWFYEDWNGSDRKHWLQKALELLDYWHSL